MLPLAGEIAIELTFAEVTVSGVLPVTLRKTALMVNDPNARAVASPLTVIEARLLLDVCHCATPVTSWVVPSEKVPIAVYCWFSPRSRMRLDGVTVIWVTVAEVTVSTVLPLTEPRSSTKSAFKR